jgi:hypothetical protein
MEMDSESLAGAFIDQRDPRLINSPSNHGIESARPRTGPERAGLMLRDATGNVAHNVETFPAYGMHFLSI